MDKGATRVTYTDQGGVLGDGTPYLMRLPSNWNGVLIRDLDLAGAKANSGPYLDLLERGFAFAGTARRAERLHGYYDPAREIRFLDMVLDLFEERFREPDRVIQYGCSGGGHVGQLVAENSDRVDGVIATGAGDRVWLANTYLDMWYVLKALVAPELPITMAPEEGAARSVSHSSTVCAPAVQSTGDWELTFAWRQTIAAAQQTPEGRGRIALAITIGQWPSWVNHTEPKPDPSDVAVLQRGMYQTVLDAANWPGGGAIRDMLESAPGFGIRSHQLSWNTDVDYREFFENGNEFQKRAVRQLYREAGVNLEADLERLNRFPPVSADPKALAYWTVPERSLRGKPKCPILLTHDIGDSVIPVSLVRGYMDLVRTNGKDDLVRVAIADSPIHCEFTIAEMAAMVETMNLRLDNGRWGSTDPENLNELGRALDPTSTPRFIPFDQYMPAKYNRMWVPV